MNKALYDMDDAGSLLRVFDPLRSIKTEPYHCVSGQTARDKCTKFPDANASNLGVITHSDLVKVTLPAAFEVPVMALGKLLDVPIANLEAYFSDISTRQCISDQCKTDTLAFLSKHENRAVAVPVSGPGRGSVFNVDTINAAIARAIFGCNHMAGQPVRLCETEIVNQYDLRPAYSAAKASHASAFEKVSITASPFYASEEYGGVFTSASGFRTKVFNDITPQKIDGISTVGTKALVEMQLSPTPPVMVDVVAAFDTIPKSVAMLNAGLALENAEQDSALEKRMSSLLNLIAPDKSAAVVFFCLGRNSWFSVNAAMRAKKLGYSKVYWYRGGLESWKAASLPTASVVLRAVAH